MIEIIALSCTAVCIKMHPLTRKKFISNIMTIYCQSALPQLCSNIEEFGIQVRRKTIKMNQIRKQSQTQEFLIIASIMLYRPSWMLLSNCRLISGLLEELVVDRPLLPKKVGCFGVGMLAVSLSSNVTTFDIAGRSPGSSCTHKSPICAHLINWFALQLSPKDMSIKSNNLFSVHSLQA